MKKILTANLGSTSYKFALFEISESGEASCVVRGSAERVSDYLSEISKSLEELKQKGFDPECFDAVAFKTVLGKNLSGIKFADAEVLKALDDMSFVAPAHNPPYAAAIRAFEKILPQLPRVALFETSFYQWAPEAWKRCSVPERWDRIGIRRNGFHGATHKFAAERAAELCGRQDAAESARNLYSNGKPLELEKPFRHVNCHLGGSSSVCGILNGASIGASMGFTPQSGLPQSNRVGDLDSMAIPFAVKTFGIGIEEATEELSKSGGLLGISGVSNDMRDIREEALKGNAKAELAIEVLCNSTLSYIGAFMAQMGGLDAISFSGGMGENNPWLREKILKPLETLGVKLDPIENEKHSGKNAEGVISASQSQIKAVCVLADEELVLVRETAKFLKNK